MPEQAIEQFLIEHLSSIRENDLEAYHRTCAEDLTLYEWWVTPHRIDGIPFHDFMMTENAKKGTVFGAESKPGEAQASSRFDLSNLRIQRYGDTAIASYTLLTTTASPSGITVASHNETRVIVRIDDAWKVVHVHKSPAWQAPHMPPQRD